MHSINFMTYALEQLIWWKILYDFWICWLLKVDVAMTCCSAEVCYFLNTANIFLVSKCFCLFSLQCRFRFGCCRWVPWNFCCVLKMQLVCYKTCFRDSVTDIMFHFFQIILLTFGKNLLYVIAKGMCVLIGVSFLLPFTFLLQVSELF